jgi:hypothetical protein
MKQIRLLIILFIIIFEKVILEDKDKDKDKDKDYLVTVGETTHTRHDP